MTLWAIWSRDSDDAERLRAEHLQAHLAYAAGLGDRIMVGGPLRGGDGRFEGSMIVLGASDAAAARAVLEADPYFKAGVWADTEIRPFRAVIGRWVGGKTW